MIDDDLAVSMLQIAAGEQEGSNRSLKVPCGSIRLSGHH